MTQRAWLLGTLLVGALVPVACSDTDRPGRAPTGPETGGEAAGGNSAQAGSAGAEGGKPDGGSADASAGDSSMAGDGASVGGGDGGSSAAGSAGWSSSGGDGPDPIPPVGDPPLCAHEAMFGTGTPLALSGTGDDLLQAITPDELSIAWKNGDAFFVADRSDIGAPFGPALQVTGGSQYSAVSLAADGLVLIGVRPDDSIVEMIRQPGGAFDDPSPSPGDFQEFNDTFASIPVGAKVLSDAVVSADQTSFFYTHFVGSDTGSRQTVHESRRDAGIWSFSSVDLGMLLHATGSQHRIPTGVSSDSLTLFYRDEVEGDFRAAWRINTQVQFDYSEVLELGDGTEAAAPNGSCGRLYFSAQGQDDLDLFVSELMQ